MFFLFFFSSLVVLYVLFLLWFTCSNRQKKGCKNERNKNNSVSSKNSKCPLAICTKNLYSICLLIHLHPSVSNLNFYAVLKLLYQSKKMNWKVLLSIKDFFFLNSKKTKTETNFFYVIVVFLPLVLFSIIFVSFQLLTLTIVTCCVWYVWLIILFCCCKWGLSSWG